MWENVVMNSGVGAEFATQYKSGGGWKDDVNPHALALDALAERFALRYIYASGAIGLQHLEEDVLKKNNDALAGSTLLSLINKQTMKDNAVWIFSQRGVGYPAIMDAQVKYIRPDVFLLE
jgi:hypothetical protein